MSSGVKSFVGVLLCVLSAPEVAADEQHEKGKVIYEKLCVECHGANGEGVKDEYDEPLYGERTVKSLAKRIDRTMPEDEEDLCVGEDAEAVAAYIHEAFYSPHARAKTHPVKRQLSRLTANQFLVSVSDALGFSHWDNGQLKNKERGLRANYWGGSNFGNGLAENLQNEKFRSHFARRDAKVDFDYGTASPEDKLFDAEQFSVRWEGSLIVEETGSYEFVIRTQNGARLFMGDLHKEPLINGWVSSGDEVREEKASLKLLGGRAYPVKIEYFKYKEKSGSIELLWKTPTGVLEVIPERNFAPEQVRKETFSLQTEFPADDRSDGYERGTSISKEWLASVNMGALEAGDYVYTNFQRLTGCKDDERDKEAGFVKMKKFVKDFASVVYRNPLSDEDVTKLLGGELTPAGVKRAVVSVLTSPRFLYPDFSEPGASPGHVIAGRMALSMWDSLPDKELWKAAEQKRLSTPEQIRQQATRMLGDPRTRIKLRGFFHHWLEIKEMDAMVKNPKKFPGIDEAVLADLRKSLDLFIDDVVWESDSDFRKLLTEESMFLNERLAGIYGKDVKGEAFQKVSFEGGGRSGIITHPYMLTSLAYYDNTSPIHRGVFLTRNVVGRVLKMPPNATEFKDADFDPTLTMREKVTNLTKATTCMGCHSSINPLGFSLESFDAIGRWRDKDNGKPINTTSDFIDDDGEKIRISSAKDVAKFAIGSESARQSFIHHLFKHMVKQPVGASRDDGIEILEKRFTEGGYKIRDLVVDSVIIDVTRGMDAGLKETAAR